MNQLGCIYVYDQVELVKLCESYPQEILNYSNKYRAFIFILRNHYESLQEFERMVTDHTVLPLNELLTQFLTHRVEDDKPIDRPIVIQPVSKYWIHDVDAFYKLPKSVENKIKDIGPHTYFYEYFFK